MGAGWARCLTACLPPADASFYEGEEGEEEGEVEGEWAQPDSIGAAAVRELEHVLRVRLDGRLAEACEALRDLAASSTNQEAIAEFGSWADAEQLGALVDDETDAARRAEIRLAGGIPLLVAALRLALNAARSESEHTMSSHNTIVARHEASVASAAAPAVQALRFLVLSPENQMAVVHAGGVPILVAALRGESLCHGIQSGIDLCRMYAPSQSSYGESQRNQNLALCRARSLGDLIFQSTSLSHGVTGNDKPSSDMFRTISEAAAACLTNVACISSGRFGIAAIAAIPLFVRLCREGLDGGRAAAAVVLWRLALDPEFKNAVAAAGGVLAMVELMASKAATIQARVHSARGLANLSVQTEVAPCIAAEGGVGAAISLLTEGVALWKRHAASVGATPRCHHEGALAGAAIDAGIAILANLSLFDAPSRQRIAVEGGVAALADFLTVATASSDSCAGVPDARLGDVCNCTTACPPCEASTFLLKDGQITWRRDQEAYTSTGSSQLPGSGTTSPRTLVASKRRAGLHEFSTGAAATCMARLTTDAAARRELTEQVPLMIRLLECGEVRTRLASAAALANLCLDSTIVSLVLDGGAAAYFIRILSEDRKGACAGDNFIQVDRPQEFDALRVAAARAVCNIVGTTDDMWGRVHIPDIFIPLLDLMASASASVRHAAAETLATLASSAAAQAAIAALPDGFALVLSLLCQPFEISSSTDVLARSATQEAAARAIARLAAKEATRAAMVQWGAIPLLEQVATTTSEGWDNMPSVFSAKVRVAQAAADAIRTLAQTAASFSFSETEEYSSALGRLIGSDIGASGTVYSTSSPIGQTARATSAQPGVFLRSKEHGAHDNVGGGVEIDHLDRNSRMSAIGSCNAELLEGVLHGHHWKESHNIQGSLIVSMYSS